MAKFNAEFGQQQLKTARILFVTNDLEKTEAPREYLQKRGAKLDIACSEALSHMPKQYNVVMICNVPSDRWAIRTPGPKKQHAEHHRPDGTQLKDLMRKVERILDRYHEGK